MECRLSYPYPRCQNMKRSRVDVAEDGTLCFKKPKVVEVAPINLNTPFRFVRSLLMDKIKLVMLSKEYTVNWYQKAIQVSSWHFLNIWYPLYSNPIYHPIIKGELKRLNSNILATWKFYCLLKMVCK